MARPINSEDDTTRVPRVQNAAGRVEQDGRGNNVWRWAKDVIDSTSVLLKRLDNKDLALEPTQKVPVMGKADKRAGKKNELRVTDQNGRDSGGGFDPYNRVTRR
jgi:hypothetical protein